MVTDRDRRFMERALFLGERGRGRTTPNPNVGAVIVTPDGTVVGQGAHLEAGGAHAELHALDAAGSRARGATLYCTLEPCSHTGRTGPCVERIVGAGIVRVVIPVQDPNPRVAGKGVAYLRAYGVEVIEGVGLEAAIHEHAPFFTWIQKKRTFVTTKIAVTRDGFVGRRDRRVAITGPRANQFLHRQRAAVDAIAVGAGTVLADDPLLTARGAYRFRPLTRLIFDWRGRVPLTARVFSTLDAGPVIMVMSVKAADVDPVGLVALERRGVIIDRRDKRELAPILRWLAARDVVSLLVEGGPALHEAFAREGLVDRMQCVVAPTDLGEGVPLTAAAMPGLDWKRRKPDRLIGDDAFYEIDVHRFD
jgi:diaminohydroxyphosphoribosylaminopyrimidine deaminase / 5-amino-6-(5-phosphoribosylamino)uracil reductase